MGSVNSLNLAIFVSTLRYSVVYDKKKTNLSDIPIMNFRLFDLKLAFLFSQTTRLKKYILSYQTLVVMGMCVWYDRTMVIDGTHHVMMLLL